MHMKKNRLLVVGIAAFWTFMTPIAAPVMASNLDVAVQAALAKSETLAAARHDWVAAREDIGTATVTTDWSATGSFTATHARSKTPASGKYSDGQTGAASVSLKRNLYDGGQMVEKTKLGKLNLEAAAASYAAQEQQIVLETIEAYLDVREATDSVALNRANIDVLGAHVEAARVRLQAGASTPTRLAEAEARLARGNSSLIAAETTLRNARDDYQTITGLAPNNLRPLAVPTNLPAGLMQAEDVARSKHPSVRIAMAQERAAESQVDSLIAAVRPNVSVTFSASETEATGTLRDKTELSAQLKLSTPLMVTNATRSKSRSVTAKIAAAQSSRDNALRSVSLNVRKAFRSYRSASAQLDAVDAELNAFKLVAQGIANEVEFGQKTDLDLQDAEQDVMDAELRLVTVNHNILRSAYRLKAALGQLTVRELGLTGVVSDLNALPAPTGPEVSMKNLIDWD